MGRKGGKPPEFRPPSPAGPRSPREPPLQCAGGMDRWEALVPRAGVHPGDRWCQQVLRGHSADVTSPPSSAISVRIRRDDVN